MIKFVYNDDWVYIYNKDNELIFADHSVDELELLRMLDVPFEAHEINGEFARYGEWNDEDYSTIPDDKLTYIAGHYDKES